MPSQLLQRLDRFLDQQKAQQIMALETVPKVDHPAPPPAQNTVPHWPAGRFGSVMGTIQCVVIHETSGTPSYAGTETFMARYTSMTNVDRAIGPQYFVETNGTAFALIGDQNFAGDPRMTAHAGWPSEHIDMNPFALGIENADIGDSSISPGNGTGPHWWQLSTQSEDLTGMKLYLVLVPDQQADAVLIWFARFPQEWVQLPQPAVVPPAPPPPPQFALRAAVSPGFQGCGDVMDGATPATTRHIVRPRAWRRMLFTERNFRSLVLVCRLLVEQHGLPRNFPLLPYASADQDRRTAAVFRKLILAEQRRDELAVQVGTTRQIIEASGAPFTQWYAVGPTAKWSRLFGVIPGQAAAPPAAAVPSRPVLPCFRGILAHSVNGGHPCPGPLFDWYRFAREVWDWWWYPFDTDAVAASTTMRPYFQARHDTPLLEYYYDATGTAADYNARHEPTGGIGANPEERFLLPLATPIYAMANGVVVAARFAGNPPGTAGFLLVRHEVFHVAANNRIDYDHPPTFVWSLTHSLDNPLFNIPAAPPAQTGATPADNPTWLNRFIMRLRECELAVQFHTAHAANATLTDAWAHNPSSAGPRATTGREIERDAATYRAITNTLNVGGVGIFPLESATDTTVVRLCLGDFLGWPGRMSSGQQGVQVEIFSKVQCPVPGAAQRTVSASTESWWREVTAALRNEASVAADLPANGSAWHYPMTDFLAWINAITWASEWEKYGVTVGGAPAPAPARSQTRIVT